MKYFKLTLLFALLIPSLAWASVSFTEIAWMGIAGTNGQYGEWLELYNDSSDAVNVAGWKLYSGGGSQLVFTLTKSIPAKSYFLIERTTASMPDPVPGVNDESGPFGGGGLSNSGEDLVLKDGSGATVQSLLFGSGWPAGDVATKDTMQWDSSKWVTAPATPKAPYAGGTDDGGGDTPPPSTSTNSTADRAPKGTPHVEFIMPSTFYKAISYKFKISPILEYMTPQFGVFKYNMGDGTLVIQSQLAPFEHTYQYPGNYTISFAYYRANYEREPMLSGTKTIEVLEPSLELAKVDDHALKIKNNTDKAVDMSDWQIKSVTTSTYLPPMSIIAPKATITIMASVLGIEAFDTRGLALVSPNGTSMATFGKVQPVVVESQSVSLVPEQASFLQASAIEATSTDVFDNTNNPSDSIVAQDFKPASNHTKEIIFGLAGLVVVALVVLLEKFMKKKEEE